MKLIFICILLSSHALLAMEGMELDKELFSLSLVRRESKILQDSAAKLRFRVRRRINSPVQSPRQELQAVQEYRKLDARNHAPKRPAISGEESIDNFKEVVYEARARVLRVELEKRLKELDSFKVAGNKDGVAQLCVQIAELKKQGEQFEAEQRKWLADILLREDSEI